MKKLILGVDIGGTKTAVVCAQEKGSSIKIMDKSVFGTTTVRDTIENIVIHIRNMAAKNNLQTTDFSAIGISCGGPLDSRNGIIMSPPNLPGWKDIHIVDILKKEFGIPCAIQNDANACALAEWKYGAGIGTRNMVFLTFGTGLGAGLILDGELYSGTNDNAGEVGHIRLSEFGPVGYGKQGSFEGFASGSGIAQLAQAKLVERYQQGIETDWCPYEKIGEVTARMIAEYAAEGDELSIEVIRTSAIYLGKGLSILVDLLNPECIVIGSIYTRNVDMFYPVVKDVMEKEALRLSSRVCQIKPAKLGDNIGDYAAISIGSNIKIEK